MKSKKIGVQMNYEKKVMLSIKLKPQLVTIEDQTIERVKKYKYLRQVITT